MQNRYVGDVGDFGKYALLRALSTEARLRLGVVWCLFPDERHNGDGRHTAYLDRRDFQVLDPDLHNRLHAIVSEGRRSVSAIAADGILPGHTVFFTEPTVLNQQRPAEREVYRARWLDKALKATASCTGVFFDPDNGLEARSVPLRGSKAGKYVFWHELDSFWRRGQSLIVYHHTNRTAPVEAQAQQLREKFEAHCPSAELLRCLVFRRGSCRLFWIVAPAHQAPAVSRAVDALLASHLGKLFEVG